MIILFATCVEKLLIDQLLSWLFNLPATRKWFTVVDVKTAQHCLPMTSPFALHLRDFRLLNGMTQADLARAIGYLFCPMSNVVCINDFGRIYG